jgi:transposase InsO family protein
MLNVFVTQGVTTRWSHMCLLSMRNHAFPKFMRQAIRLKANFFEHQIQSVRLDNIVEFSSWAFNDYCIAQGIQVQYSVPYVHTKNGLAESLIKWIKLIARPLLHNCNLPISYWGHVVLHVANIIQLQPTAYHNTSLLYLVRGNASSIFHLWKFGCTMYTPISLQKRTSMPP